MRSIVLLILIALRKLRRHSGRVEVLLMAPLDFSVFNIQICLGDGALEVERRRLVAPRNREVPRL